MTIIIIYNLILILSYFYSEKLKTVFILLLKGLYTQLIIPHVANQILFRFYPGIHSFIIFHLQLKISLSVLDRMCELLEW